MNERVYTAPRGWLMAIEGLNGAEMTLAVERQRIPRRAWCWFRRARPWVAHPQRGDLVTLTRGPHAGSPVVAGSELALCLGFTPPPALAQLEPFGGKS